MIPMLRAVGIRAKLKTPEWSTLWSNVRKGKVPFYYMGRGGMVDPSSALSQYFETGIAPRIKFSSKKVDALLQKERQTFDLAKRKKYMNDAINAIMEEVPAHFLWHQKIHYGVANGVDIAIRPDKRIHGYEISVKKTKTHSIQNQAPSVIRTGHFLIFEETKEILPTLRAC